MPAVVVVALVALVAANPVQRIDAFIEPPQSEEVAAAESHLTLSTGSGRYQ